MGKHGKYNENTQTHKVYSIQHRHKEEKRAHEADSTKPNLGQTRVDAAQAQHATTMRKAVTGRLHLGAAAPLAALIASSFHVASPSGSSKAAACESKEYSSNNRPIQPYKKMGEASSFTHTYTFAPFFIYV